MNALEAEEFPIGVGGFGDAVGHQDELVVLFQLEMHYGRFGSLDHAQRFTVTLELPPAKGPGLGDTDGTNELAVTTPEQLIAALDCCNNVTVNDAREDAAAQRGDGTNPRLCAGTLRSGP